MDVVILRSVLFHKIILQHHRLALSYLERNSHCIRELFAKLFMVLEQFGPCLKLMVNKSSVASIANDGILEGCHQHVDSSRGLEYRRCQSHFRFLDTVCLEQSGHGESLVLRRIKPPSQVMSQHCRLDRPYHVVGFVVGLYI